MDSKSSTSSRVKVMFLRSFRFSCVVAGPFKIMPPRSAAGRAPDGSRSKASPE